jgi:putative phosphoesterase
MVKIGIISDIHADLEGLDLALALLKSEKVDRIICAGDLVERGETGDKVVQRIREAAIPTVMGNHDMIARSNQEYCLKFPERFPNYPVLIEETFNYLATLPRHFRFVEGDKRLYLAHGAPWDVDSYIFLRQPPQQFRRVLKEADADIVILGHTHQPMLVEVEGKGWVVNAGSTSNNHLPLTILLDTPPRQRSCGILSLPQFCFQVYDLDTGKPLDVPYRLIKDTII